MNKKIFNKSSFFTSLFICIILIGCNSTNNNNDCSDSAIIDSVPSVSDSFSQNIRQGSFSNARIRVNYFGNFREIFNDSNKYQYAYAEKLGIEPITDIQSCYNTRQPIVKIESNDYYFVDKLTHSLPYLVPQAANLLHDIGKNFIDSLAKRGADGYKIKVTSLLRTPSTVKRLRKVNVNASDSSTHQFGTTFDISYNHFYCMDSTRTINGNDLKGLLGEVLYDLRKQQRCMVKYEYKTACFHITAIK